MKTEIVDTPEGKKLVITMDINKPSHKDGGKLDLVVNSRGWQQTETRINGKTLKLNVCGGIPIG